MARCTEGAPVAQHASISLRWEGEARALSHSRIATPVHGHVCNTVRDWSRDPSVRPNQERVLSGSSRQSPIRVGFLSVSYPSHFPFRIISELIPFLVLSESASLLSPVRVSFPSESYPSQLPFRVLSESASLPSPIRVDIPSPSVPSHAPFRVLSESVLRAVRLAHLLPFPSRIPARRNTASPTRFPCTTSACCSLLCVHATRASRW